MAEGVEHKFLKALRSLAYGYRGTTLSIATMRQLDGYQTQWLARVDLHAQIRSHNKEKKTCGPMVGVV